MRYTILLVIAFAAVLLLHSPPLTHSTLHPHQRLANYITKDGFRATLTHVSLGKSELRGRKRVQSLGNAWRSITSFPVGETGVLDGAILMNLSVGTPPREIPLYFDTGSALTWFQCQPCNPCFKQPTPIFDPSKSSSYSDLSCPSNLCVNKPYHCAGKLCSFKTDYGDGFTYEGHLATETFWFPNQAPVQGVAFGCTFNGTGDVDDGRAAGYVGLNRGPLSLVRQLHLASFWHCLPLYDSKKTGVLVLDSSFNRGCPRPYGMITTPLITSSINPSFYYISVKGISVGGIRLQIPESAFGFDPTNGGGGVILDMGTTNMCLKKIVYDRLGEEFSNQIRLLPDDGTKYGYEFCYKTPQEKGRGVEVPKVTFHLEWGADWELPQVNYFTLLEQGRMGCLAMERSFLPDDASVIGSVQLQNTFAAYNLVFNTISLLTNVMCDKL